MDCIFLHETSSEHRVDSGKEKEKSIYNKGISNNDNYLQY